MVDGFAAVQAGPPALPAFDAFLFQCAVTYLA